MITRVDRLFIGVLIIVTLSSGWWHLSRQPGLVDKLKEEIEKAVPEQGIVEKGVEEADDALTVLIPDFGSMLDVREKKATFFSFIKALVDKENQALSELRTQLFSVQRQSSLTPSEEEWVLGLAKRYRVDEKSKNQSELLDVLLLKVDVIPVSLALVQAANESAWGTSRFALDANNFFGQWCFKVGCGLVPERRPEGARYEVQKFLSPAHSVSAYMYNLNSSHHYEGLREMRRKRRDAGDVVTGPVLAQGLYAYSIRGVEYVDELVKMIEGNDLLRYDLEHEKK